MIVLDTHIWHWWTNQIPNKLSSSLIDLIEESDDVAVSAISCFELAWLVRHERIDLGCSFQEWFEEVEVSECVRFLPVTPSIASLAVSLPEHHKDPQDRIIIATALIHNAKLLSFDTVFPNYEELHGRLINQKWR
ncbi:MAG: type II toxin-antitoxin system VapC family toxin [Methylococcales bacterium]|nr:type II toxin-antitoxin system VapC family toxin [Methylococcales bacterium]